MKLVHSTTFPTACGMDTSIGNDKTIIKSLVPSTRNNNHLCGLCHSSKRPLCTGREVVGALEGYDATVFSFREVHTEANAITPCPAVKTD